MIGPRAIVGAIAIFVYVAAGLLYAQTVKNTGSVPAPWVEWLQHPRTFTVAMGGMLGGVLEVIIGSSVSFFRSPNGIFGIPKRLAFNFISAFAILPWAFETLWPEASVGALMAFSCIATMAAPQLVPLLKEWAQARGEQQIGILGNKGHGHPEDDEEKKA